MASWRARSGAATLSILLHAALLWIVAGWVVTEPGAFESDLDRVVVTLAQPKAPPPPPAPVAPPPPPAAVPPPDDVATSEAEPPPEPPAEQPKELEIPLPEQQIVSMPDAGEERPPEDTRFLSDRDNVVEEQMVKRGEPAPSQDQDGDDIAAADPESESSDKELEVAAVDLDDIGAPPAPADSGVSDRPLPDLESLLPNALALAQQQARDEMTPRPESGGAPPAKARQRSAVAWEPSTALRGTLDHLPDVRPGNVTLLNTKAEVFAPFVRRVMLRVFQNMMILMRRNAATMRPGANEQIEAEAIMSQAGEMIGLRFTQRSTSMSIGLDRMLTEACNEAFFDRNPPPGAVAKDGNIHFVMRTVVQTYPAPGGGVALSGLFGVGLL